MLPRNRRLRPSRFNQGQAGQWAEALESRRLLAATPINVAAGLTFATGLPVAGLASGMGLATTLQTLPTANVSVSPAPVTASFGPASIGPATTLSPLPNDTETAVATASEVARPTPGRSDRISNVVEAPEIIPIPHLSPPDAFVVIPGPQILVPPVAPAPDPAQPAAEPARPADPAMQAAPAPAPAPTPQAPKGSETPVGLETWDAALDLVAADLSEGSSPSIVLRTEGAMAAGVLLAAWGGWKYSSRFEGRSRRHPLAIAAAEPRRDGTGV